MAKFILLTALFVLITTLSPVQCNPLPTMLELFDLVGNRRMVNVTQTEPNFINQIDIENTFAYPTSPKKFNKSARENIVTHGTFKSDSDYNIIHLPENPIRWINCGLGGRCDGNTEMCIAWDRINCTKREVGCYRSFYECFPKQGNHWMKMAPTQEKLCPENLNHHIVVPPEGEKCLENKPPCDLRWQFRCVPNNESPHDCRLKQCPDGQICVEDVTCNFHLPCFKEATCIAGA